MSSRCEDGAKNLLCPPLEENQLEKYVFETYELLSGTKKLNNRLEIIESHTNTVTVE